MTFKEKIRLHQEGTYNLTDELLELAQSDHVVTTTLEYKFVVYDGNLDKKRWKPKRTIGKREAEYFIAIAMKTILARHAKKAYKLRKGFKDDGRKLDVLYLKLQKMDMHYTIDNLDKITMKQLQQMEDHFGYWDIEEWLEIYHEFVAVLPAINEEKQKYYDEILPLIKEALDETLSRVNLELDDKQLVKYIVNGIRWGTYGRLSKLLGSRTFRISGKTYYVSEFHMAGTDVEALLGVDKKVLTAAQLDFINRLIQLVNSEIEAGNNAVFTFDEKGYIIKFQKRYFSRLMGVKEDAFKHRLISIQGRGAEHEKSIFHKN